jgi:hypothetical protein
MDVGIGWLLVRRASQRHDSWHRASDWLAGTEEYEIDCEGLSALSSAEEEEWARGDCSFSVKFNVSAVHSFLFATGDCVKWTTVRASSLEAAQAAAQPSSEASRALFADEESVHWDVGLAELLVPLGTVEAVLNGSATGGASSTFYVVSQERCPR